MSKRRSIFALSDKAAAWGSLLPALASATMFALYVGRVSPMVVYVLVTMPVCYFVVLRGSMPHEQLGLHLGLFIKYAISFIGGVTLVYAVVEPHSWQTYVASLCVVQPALMWLLHKTKAKGNSGYSGGSSSRGRIRSNEGIDAPRINPATGLHVVGGIDAAGNVDGTTSMEDMHRATHSGSAGGMGGTHWSQE